MALADGNPVGARRNLDQAGAFYRRNFPTHIESASNQTQTMLGSLGSQNVQRASELAQEQLGYDADTALELMKVLEGVSSRQLADLLSEIGGDPRRAAWFDLALTVRNNPAQCRIAWAEMSVPMKRPPP